MEKYALRSFVLCLLVTSLAIGMTAGDGPSTPRLLLTPQKLRRLQRDRERQTARWSNFETRVQTVSDSPERGFELALYFAITHDEVKGREAIEWAKAHRCERRQVALILDWCRELVPANFASPVPECPAVVAGAPSIEAARNRLFMQVAAGEESAEPDREEWRTIQATLEDGGFADAKFVYAASEYLLTVRTAQHTDLRRESVQFFGRLPTEFLLSMRPAQMDKPDWMAHVAALALVGLDPNLEGSQFVQGWAIEDRHMLRDGPGVAYELLWADPYLPGVGYQNLDPWVYDPNGRVLARTGWDSNACWVDISARGVQEQNCPAVWEKGPAQFGRMTLIPVTARCVDVPRHASGESVLLWKLKPRETVAYPEQKRHETSKIDPAGIFLVPLDVAGKVCAAR